MFAQIDTLRMARDLGAHAALRQRIVAQNVANADTPAYRAQDIGSFAESLHAGPALGLRTTDPRHLPASWDTGPSRVIDAGGEPSPNGNTVSVEDELVRGAEARREFDLSLAVMRSGMDLLRTSIGRRG